MNIFRFSATDATTCREPKYENTSVRNSRVITTLHFDYRTPKSISDTLFKRQVIFLAYFVQKSYPTESKTPTSRFSVSRATRPYVIPPLAPNTGRICPWARSVLPEAVPTQHTQRPPPYRTFKHLPWGYLGYHKFFTR